MNMEYRHQRTTVRLACPADREQIIRLIDTVAGERRYLQTDRYVPTPAWEQLLSKGVNLREGLLLLVIESGEQTIGFARLTPDLGHPSGRLAGNIGITLLPAYRSQGIGTFALGWLMACAARLQYQTLTANILSTNLRSLRLFRKFGFAPAAVKKIYLPFVGSESEEVTVEWI